MPEKQVQKGIFEGKKENVIKLHNVEVHNRTLHQTGVRIMISSKKICVAIATHTKV
jgi:hypothetical protein